MREREIFLRENGREKKKERGRENERGKEREETENNEWRDVN